MSSLTKPKQVPPNIRHTRGANKYPLTIKERQEDYSRPFNHEQTRQYSAGSVPSTASSNPHDMNKQGALSSQPQLISNLYGPVSNQHSQSGMPGSNHGSSSTLVQPSQGQLHGRVQPQSNMQTYYGGRSNASANYGISRAPGMTVASSGISTNAPFSGQLTNSMMYAPSQNPYGNHVTASAMLIPSLTYPQNHYATAQYPQQVIFRGSNSPYFNTSGTVYYPSVNMPVSRTNMNSIGANNTASAPPPKREKKIITISDEAGRDLTQEILSTAKNDILSSSNASTSQVNSNDHGQITISVAAQFAEQVAAAVKGPSKTPPLIASQNNDTVAEKELVEVEQFGEVCDFDSSVKAAILENDENGSKTPPPLISPSQISNCVELHLQEQELGNILNDKPLTFPPSDHIDIHHSSSFKIIGNSVENDLALPVSTDSSFKPISVPSAETETADVAIVDEKLESRNTPREVSPDRNLLESSKLAESESERHSTDLEKENEIDDIQLKVNEIDSESISVQEDISDSHVDAEQSLPDSCVDTERILPDSNVDAERVLPQDENVEIECSPTKAEEQAAPSEKEDIIMPASETCVSMVNKTVVNDAHKSKEEKVKENGAIKTTAETKKEGKERKSKGKKWKELNKRGETKEGDDMDAFIDKSDVISQSLSASSVSSASTSPIPQVVLTSSKIENEISLLEEQRKVAEKNEENKRVSIAAENSHDEKSVELISSSKYNYSEDQWSPSSLEGRKTYDRAFLLTVQAIPYCLQKPKHLPKVEIVKDKAVLHKLPDHTHLPMTQLPNRPDPFMPNFARSSRPPPGSVNRRQSQQGKEKVKRVINMPGSLTQDVKLHSSDNAWKASNNNKKNSTEDPEEAETRELYKKVTGILNKLTPQKFHTLVEQVKQLNIDTEARLRGVIDLVFEKAVDEPNFSVPYANMCKQLAVIKVAKAEPSANDKEKDVNFKKLLLMKCQREFEKDNTDECRYAEKLTQIRKAETEEMKKQLKEELAEEERKSRHRSLGNIKFIGELYKLHMLTFNIMHECIRKLLRQGDDESLECLCRLLTTIGKELEADKPKLPNQKVPSMDPYFEKMQSIVNKRKTSSRVRFMLQDVIELKQNYWVPRRDDNNPKTIDQIHREAAREAQQQQQQLQQTPFPKRSVEDRNTGRKNRNSPAYNNNDDDGWNSIHSNKSKAAAIDPSKLKLSSKTVAIDAGSVHLGHAFSKWGQGSSGGQSKAAKQENGMKSAVLSTNRYSALLVDQNQPNYEHRRGSQRSAASSRESSRSGASNLPPPPVRKTSSQTSTKERKQAVEAVKDITRPDAPKQRYHNSVQPLESASMETSTVLQGANLSEEDMETKTKPLIDEFLHNCDFKEATTCVIETVSLSTAPMFISAAISHVLERSSQGRRLVGQLMHQLVKKKIIPLDSYIAGLKSVLETADDCSIDVPKIWQYLGELIEPMIQDNTIPLGFLKDAAQPCVASGTGGKLVTEVLHAAAKNQGNIRVAELWKAAGLQWSDFLSETVNVSDFVKQNNLEFTISDLKIETTSEELSLDAIKTQLDCLLRRKADNEEIFDWITAQVRGREKSPEFIRALTTSLAESAIEGEVSISSFDKKKLLPRVPLLQNFVDQDIDLELQSVFALQALVNRREHPKGLLRELFEFFFDEDLISEDAFTQWEQDTDPAEQEGKGVALKSVTSFMTWIREQEDDSLDDN